MYTGLVPRTPPSNLRAAGLHDHLHVIVRVPGCEGREEQVAVLHFREPDLVSSLGVRG